MPDYPPSLEIAQKLLVQQGEINDLRAKVAKVRDIHSEFKVYEVCRHAVHEDDQETAELADGDTVCASGYRYSVCRECCAPGGELSEACDNEHDHAECWPCVTRLAVDEPVAEVARS